MFVIRDAQMAAFQEARDDDFIRWMVVRLRDVCSSATAHLDDSEMRRRVKIGLSRSRAYRLNTPSAHAEFITLMFRFTPAFDREPRVRAVLDDPVRTPESMLHMIPGLLTKDEWEILIRNARGDEW